MFYRNKYWICFCWSFVNQAITMENLVTLACAVVMATEGVAILLQLSISLWMFFLWMNSVQKCLLNKFVSFHGCELITITAFPGAIKNYCSFLWWQHWEPVMGRNTGCTLEIKLMARSETMSGWTGLILDVHKPEQLAFIWNFPLITWIP